MNFKKMIETCEANGIAFMTFVISISIVDLCHFAFARIPTDKQLMSDAWNRLTNSFRDERFTIRHGRKPKGVI